MNHVVSHVRATFYLMIQILIYYQRLYNTSCELILRFPAVILQTKRLLAPNQLSAKRRKICDLDDDFQVFPALLDNQFPRNTLRSDLKYIRAHEDVVPLNKKDTITLYGQKSSSYPPKLSPLTASLSTNQYVNSSSTSSTNSALSSRNVTATLPCDNQIRFTLSLRTIANFNENPVLNSLNLISPTSPRCRAL